MRTEEKGIREFIEALSGKDPVPGGGGASALAGAYGVSLGMMVGNLTHGKKKYEAFEPKLAVIMDKLKKLREEFLVLSDEDEKVFLPLSQAYGLPRNTEEEALHREEVLEQRLTDASLTPLKVMERACEALNYMSDLAENGSTLAISDVGVGVQFLNTALSGAVMNVYINTRMMKNENKAAELNDYAEKLLLDGTAKARLVYETVEKALKPCYNFETRRRHDKVDFGD